MTTGDERTGRRLAGTWIRTEPTVEIFHVAHAGDGYVAVVDRPAAMRFREPVEVVVGGVAGTPRPGRNRVEVGDGAVVVDSDGTRTPLRKVLQPWPTVLDQWCGWYDGDRRTVLLTQFPEEYFGDPMCLIHEGDTIVRAYPVDERSLVREDGDGTIELVPDDPPARAALRLRGGELLTRTVRYREEQIAFPVGDAMLAGTLIRPAGPGPHPAAVIAHGAAGGQRDFCRLFADALLEAGVAAFIYDKRGHGRSEGAAGPTIFDQADAVSAALDVLGEVPGLDPARRGLLGFSNGMWAVPRVAAVRQEVAFVAGVGSPGVSQASSEVHRRTKLLREAGVTPATLELVAESWRCIFDIGAAGHASDASTVRLSTLLARLSSAPDLLSYETPDYARQNPMLSAVPPPVPVADLLGMITGSPHPDLVYDPVDDYRRLRCPVFLQYGAEDTSVPVATSVERISAALHESVRPRSAINVYPNLEHMLDVIPEDVTGIASQEAAYLFHSFRYGPGVKADLTTWLRNTLGLGD